MSENEVTIRELRNHGGDVMNRVAGGERLTVTKAGTAVAELRPVRRAPLKSTVLLQRWRRLQPIDSCQLRQDIDAVIDSSL